MGDPYTIKRNDKVGRYVVTSRALKAGEEVLVESPWVVGPKSGTQPQCLGCYWPSDGSVVCTKCGWPVCGPECEARANHRDFECKVFSAAKQKYQREPPEDIVNGSPQYECITPLRMCLMKEKNPERWEKEVKHLEGHMDQRCQMTEWTSELVNVVEFLRRKCQLEDRFSAEQIQFCISVLAVNAFEVRTEYGVFVRGLYPKTALMSHCCVANTTHTIYASEEFKSRIRVTVDVPEGGELYVSYTSSIQPTIMRRETLWFSKYFWCDCKRCADPTELGTHLSTLKCTKCDNGIITSPEPLNQEAVWKCSHCEFTIRPEIVKKICRMIQDEIDQLETIEGLDTKIEVAEKLMKKYRSVLHPRNVYMTSLRHNLVQWYGRAPGYTFQDLPDILLERKIDLCRQVLEVADVVKPGKNRFRGLVLYELHVPLMLFNRHRYEYQEIKKEELKQKMDEVVKVLEEAVEILLLEDPRSPEGGIGQVGVQSLEQLKASIQQI